MPVPKTILLVDDEPDILDTLRLVFAKKGYRIVTAADGDAALAAAEREAPDLVVVDMTMPKQSGFQVLDRLKHWPQGAPRVIMITGNDENKYRLNAERLGVDGFFRKPFDLDELAATIQRLCPLV